MTTGELITRAIKTVLMINDQDGEEYPVANEAETRIRCLGYAQEAVDWWWIQKDWDCRKSHGIATVALAAGASEGDLPADFGIVGEEMTVYITGKHQQLFWKQPKVIRRMLEAQPTPGLPSLFTTKRSFADGEVANTILVAVPTSAAITLDVSDYLIARPTLIDEVLDNSEADNGTELNIIPEIYHYNVILMYVQKKLEHSEGDARAPQDFAELRQAVIDGWRDENPQSEVLYTPRYGRGSHVR